jgi:hypothetical protein
MPDLPPGSVVRANDTPPVQWSSQTTAISTVTTTYTTTVSSGTYVAAGVAFTAPTTGRVKITCAARTENTAAAGTHIASDTKTGSTIGSGTTVEAADDSFAVQNYSGTRIQAEVSHILEGLTPGDMYNSVLLHRVTSNTGTFAFRKIIVEAMS